MRKLQFGMPTLIEHSHMEECVALCLELGLQFVEINMNLPQYQADKLDMRLLQDAKEKGLYFTFHLDENLNVADFNQKVANAYMDTVLETIAIAKELDAPILNMHMAEGVHFKLPAEKVYLFEKYNDCYMNSLLAFRKKCHNMLTGSGIKICIENCNGYLPFMKKGTDFLLESDAFGLTYDIGHNYCAGNADEGFILARKERLFHMHIHDAKDKRCHLVLGSGDMDLQNKLELAVSQGCRCVIETKSVSGLRESVHFLRTTI